jgi:hypothetical protein
MRRNKENIRNLASIVNHIVSQLRAKIWGSLRRHRVDHIKIATSNLPFGFFLLSLIHAKLYRR